MVVAVVVENGIRIAIPLSLYGAWEAGSAVGEAGMEESASGIFPAELTADEESELREARELMRDP